MSRIRSAARSLPPPPPASTSSRRPRKLYAPHPDGPIVDVYASEEDRRRDDEARKWTLATWLFGRPHCRYLQVFQADAVRRAIHYGGCPHRSPVLMTAWLVYRRCPVCFRRIVPDAAWMHRGQLGLTYLARRRFCSEDCSRAGLRDELTAPTLAQIQARTREIQDGWDDADRMRALEANPLRELLADLSDSVPLDLALLSL